MAQRSSGGGVAGWEEWWCSRDGTTEQWWWCGGVGSTDRGVRQTDFSSLREAKCLRERKRMHERFVYHLYLKFKKHFLFFKKKEDKEMYD